MWNALPLQLKEINQITEFKEELMKFLLSTDQQLLLFVCLSLFYCTYVVLLSAMLQLCLLFLYCNCLLMVCVSLGYQLVGPMPVLVACHFSVC